MRKFISAALTISLIFIGSMTAQAVSPQNVIILVGDGMGFHHVDAGSLYRYGQSKGQVYWEMAPLAMQTYSLNNPEGYDPQKAQADFDYVRENPTDSAAAATALWTGHKTHNGMLGMLQDGTQLPLLMDDAEALGKSTGVLSTVFFTHATPAGFVARNISRNNYQEISYEMIWESPIDFIMGPGHPWYDEDGKQVGGQSPNRFETPLSYDRVGGQESWADLLESKPAHDADGDGSPDAWNLVTSRDEVQALASAENPGRVLGVLPVYSTLQASRSGDAEADAGPYEAPFNRTSPTMAEMMQAALNVLSQNENGFILAGEGGAIDWASHGNHAGRMIEEQIDFDRAVEATVEWIEENSSWDETLLIVTSDHECGYLTGPASDPTLMPLVNRGAGIVPGLEWHSGGHTNQVVPFFAKGPGTAEIQEAVVGVDERYGPYVDNTVIAQTLRTAWQEELPKQLGFLVRPYLQWARQDGITIMCETTTPAQVTVHYGEATRDADEPNLSQSQSGEASQTMHEIKLNGLNAETPYFYQVVAEDQNGRRIESEVLSFKTNVEDDSAFAFAVFSDSQTNPEIWGKIAQLGWEERPNFALHAGDLVGTGSNKSHWVDHFFNPGHVLMGRIPLYSILGNHEDDADYYYQYMANPEPEYYYTFTYGNAQFFVVDSDRDLSPGSEIHTWLDQALAESDSEWKFVMHHHPPYTSDENDYGDTYRERSLQGDPDVQPLIPLYDEHEVDMVFFGHIHDYERTWPLRDNEIDLEDGVIYIQTGGSGGSLENYAPVRSWFTQKVKRDHHFCLVNIYEDHLDFQAIDQHGNVFDSFTMEK